MTRYRQSVLLQHMREKTDLLSDPLFIIDVGCSQGFPAQFRQFEPGFAGVGFDPLSAEIERLASLETNPAVTYEAAWVAPADGISEPADRVAGWRERSSSTAALNQRRKS